MPGYQTDVASIVGELKNRLTEYAYDPKRGGDRGRGDSLLRELVQNADDARASIVRFVLLKSGLPDSANSLLKGAALVAINDGPLEPEHSAALLNINRSSKAAEHGAVGRFGIGQQSVFHLCEAFLFVGSSATHGVSGNVLDPWSSSQGDDEHPDWDPVDAKDQKALISALTLSIRPLLPGGDDWFALWLPLRLREHKRERGDVIVQRFEPAISKDLRSALCSEELGLLRPQLRHVRAIECFDLDQIPQAHGLSAPSFRVEAGEAVGLRRVELPEGEAKSERTEAGALRIGERTLTVTVCERHHLSERLERLRTERTEAGDWPAVVHTDHVKKERRTEPEKALPHGAVTIVRREAERGSATVTRRWAVFLPVEIGQGDPTPAPTSRFSWWITLHGYWFLDHGRRKIPGLSRAGRADPFTDEDPKLSWNHLLHEDVVLSCLLPAVAAAVRDLDADEATPLVAACRGLLPEGWSSPRMLIAPAFEDRWSEAASEGRRVLPIPRPPVDALALRQAFAALPSRKPVLVFTDRLPLWTAGCAKWTEDEVDAVLVKSLELVSSPAVVSYLASWLASVEPETRRRPLARFLWAAAARRELPGPLAAVASDWRALVALAAGRDICFVKDRALKLSTLSAIAEGTPNADVIVLQEHLAPQGLRGPGPRPADLRVVFSFLAQQQDGECHEVLRNLVSTLGPEAVLRADQLTDIAIIAVASTRLGERLRLTVSEAQRRLAEGQLHVSLGVFGRRDIPPALIAAIASDDFDLCFVDLLKGDEEAWQRLGANPLSEEGLVRPLLGTLPLHEEADRRSRLFELLLRDFGRGRNESTRRALRNLIHGEASKASGTQSLWYVEAPLDSEMAKAVLDDGPSWRVVPNAVNKLLNPAEREWLDIELMPDDVLRYAVDDLFLQRRLEAVLGKFDPSDTRRLLVTLRHRLETARKLPVHEESGTGRLLNAMGPLVYRDDGAPIPPDLRTRVAVVKLDSDPDVASVQRQLLPAWNVDATITVALATIGSDPSFDAAPHVLGALAAGAFVTPEVSSNPWVTTTAGGRVRPDRVCVLPAEMQRALGSALTEAGLVDESLVDESIRGHPSWRRHATQMTCSVESAWRILLELLERNPQAAKALAIVANREDVSRLARQVREINSLWSELEDFPEWYLVIHVPGHLLTRACAVAAGSPTLERCGERLNKVARTPHRGFFGDYLASALKERDSDGVRRLIDSVPLQCADGEWRPAREIALEGDGLHERYRLSPDLAKVLEWVEWPESPEPETGEPRALSSPAELRVLFEKWFERSASSNAAALLFSLLGGGRPEWEQIADEWLRPIQKRAADLRADFLRPPISQMNQSFRRPLGAQGGIWDRPIDALADTKTNVAIVERGGLLPVRSLTGSWFRASTAMGTGGYSLFAGSLGRLDRPRRTLNLVRPPKELSGQEMTRALRGAVERLLQEHLGRALVGFAGPWDQLTHGKVHLHAVRALVERDLPATLRQLGAHAIPAIGKALKELNLTDIRVAELSVLQAPGKDASAELESLRARQQSCSGTLGRLVREHQAAVLDRVRGKLGEYSYTPPQVLWELLQNADDAVIQLVPPAALHEHEAERRRTVEIDICLDTEAHELRLVHYGRRINGPGWDSSLEYELDLHHMVVLNLSDKGNQGAVTGKFGLGFKSVHLITQKPTVVSGELSFAIEAGLWPRELGAVPGDVPVGATSFRLPLESGVSGADLLDGLEKWVPFFTVFAAGIRKVRVGTRTYRWAPDVRETPGDELRVENGTLQFTDGTCQITAAVREIDGRRHVVAFESTAEGSPIASRRVATSPTVWVTAPAQSEDWGLPWCFGGPFELDVGRRQLAPANQKNRETAIQLGEQLADVYRVFDQEGRDHGFWVACWDTFVGPATVAILNEGSTRSELLRSMHRGGRGGSWLARHHLPTKLPWGGVGTTVVSEVSWFVPGTVAKPVLAILGAAVDGSPGDLPAAGSMVSEEVHRALLALGEGNARVSLGLAELLARLDPPLSRSVAPSTKALIRCVAGLDLMAADDERRREWLGRRKFPSSSGGFALARELLVGSLPEALPSRADRAQLQDETLRARFADPQCVLAPAGWASETEGLEALLACRTSPLSVGGSGDLASWAKKAKDQDTRTAVLDYLLRGNRDLAARVAVELRKDRRWLPQDRPETTHPLFAHFGEEQRVDLINMLYPVTQAELKRLGPLAPLSELPPPPPNSVDPRRALAACLEQYRQSKDELLRKHDERIFGKALRLEVDPKTDAYDRESWLALFTRAAMFRLGRASDDQHVAFMRLAWSKKNNWFHQFSQSEDAALPSIIDGIQRDAVQNVPFIHWLQVLIFTYWFGRHLDEYVEYLLTLDERDIGLGANVQLDSRASALESGGGYDLAPMSVLRYGTPFVVRELRRRGVLRSAAWDPLGYSANAALRRGLAKVGYDDPRPLRDLPPMESSRHIHGWIAGHLGAANASLDLGFDLALTSYAPKHSPDLAFLDQYVDDEL